jgi:membrane protein YqaA with SNARE-associated domain
MTLDELVPRLGLPLATLAYGVVSGFVPVVNAEIFLVAVSALAPPERLPLVVIMATLGQMVAKALLYLAGRGIVRLPLGRYRDSLEETSRRLERWGHRDLLVLVSSTTGFPPFYATTLVAGALRFPFARFLVAGAVGRIVRFSLVVAVPAVGRWLLGDGT